MYLISPSKVFCHQCRFELDSIPWVRCASGNVYRNSRTIVLETFGGEAFSVADILVLVRIQQSFLWVLGIQFVMCLENLKFEPEWRENVRSSPSYHNPATELSGLGENRPLQHLTRFTDFHRINFSKCENIVAFISLHKSTAQDLKLTQPMFPHCVTFSRECSCKQARALLCNSIGFTCFVNNKKALTNKGFQDFQ